MFSKLLTSSFTHLQSLLIFLRSMASPISDLAAVDGAALSRVGASASAPSLVVGASSAVNSAAKGTAMAAGIVAPLGVTVASAGVASPFAGSTSGKD